MSRSEPEFLDELGRVQQDGRVDRTQAIAHADPAANRPFQSSATPIGSPGHHSAPSAAYMRAQPMRPAPDADLFAPNRSQCGTHRAATATATARPSAGPLLDESLHLAAACQVAGFPYVVGTLWPVLDSHSPEFAERFYTALTDDGRLDLGRSARAVHQVKQDVRDQGLARAPHMWASWLHYGA